MTSQLRMAVRSTLYPVSGMEYIVYILWALHGLGLDPSVARRSHNLGPQGKFRSGRPADSVTSGLDLKRLLR